MKVKNELDLDLKVKVGFKANIEHNIKVCSLGGITGVFNTCASKGCR